MSGTAIEAKIAFMGTPQFAVPSLRALARGPYMLTVVTQPDRPAGRGGKVTPPPVKVAAEEIGLPVWQPASLRDPVFRERFAALAPDATVLVAYGEYLSGSLLDLPRRGSINLHPSLLPRWRGSTPVQAAILAGDAVTGVTIIRMDKGLDTGPVIAQRPVTIEPDETASHLAARLANEGAQLLSEVLPLWLRGEIEPVPQAVGGAIVSREITKEAGLIDWTHPAEEIARQVRAYDPWPGAYSYWNGKLFKILHARPLLVSGDPLRPPGTVYQVKTDEGRGVAVATGDGALLLEMVQLEGKQPTGARALLSGYPQLDGSVLRSQL